MVVYHKTKRRHKKLDSSPSMEAVGVSSAFNFDGLLFKLKNEEATEKLILKRSDGEGVFSSEPIPLVIKTQAGVLEKISNCHSFNIVSYKERYLMSYVKKTPSGMKTIIALSKNGLDWIIQSATSKLSKDKLFLLGRCVYKNGALAYTSGFNIAMSSNLKTWQFSDLIIPPSLRQGIPRGANIIGVIRIAEGILILYEWIHKTAKFQELSVGGMLCSVFHPYKVTWVSQAPLFREELSLKEEILTLGIIPNSSNVSVFWKVGSDILFVELPELFSHSPEVGKVRLNKYISNPIITPVDEHEWESDSTFNPASVYVGDRVHLLYRAMSREGVSRIGYASSLNGLVFDERLPYPAYSPTSSFRGPLPKRVWNFPSGGGWGGSEDPRAVLIDGKIYVSFSAFDGWDFIRLAIISISDKDFLAKNFNAWEGPFFISPPGEIHKNWVIFPEKINGKFAILHSISPKIEVEYRNSIEDIGDKESYIQSWAGSRDRCDNTRIGFWDNKLRGVGPPPIKTDKGWLLFYHAIDMREPSKYKLGVMLLDLNDPTKILNRTRHPILIPDQPYENKGKPGVVYACGAVVKDNTLYLYYGGADRVVCVAKASLSEFLYNLERDKPLSLSLRKALIQ